MVMLGPEEPAVAAKKAAVRNVTDVEKAAQTIDNGAKASADAAGEKSTSAKATAEALGASVQP
ncbi:MAG: hypothetical protein LLG37_02035 [Spirochaetia bacterium]|nr:hypothetical protein [Spirochaetia bacterium]